MDWFKLEECIRNLSCQFSDVLVRVGLVEPEIPLFHIRPKRTYNQGDFQIHPRTIDIKTPNLHQRKAWPHPVLPLPKNKHQVDEWIWITADGTVLEAEWSNIWLEKNGQLFTPPSTEPLLQGIMRTAIIIAAEALSILTQEAVLKWDPVQPWVLSSCAKFILHTKDPNMSPQMERINQFIKTHQRSPWFDEAISARLKQR